MRPSAVANSVWPGWAEKPGAITKMIQRMQTSATASSASCAAICQE